MWHSLFNEKERHVLFILGLGFDERMCLGLEALSNADAGRGKRDIQLLTFDEGPESASQALADQRLSNQARLEHIVESFGWHVVRRSIELVSSDGRSIGGRSIAKEFSGPEDVFGYTDVVLDISALPRALYFPLLAKLLNIYDTALKNCGACNLHVIVAQSPMLDASIRDEGIDENATFLHGFSAAEFEREATQEQPCVWIPVLGRGQQVQLERINELVSPDEICPVLPSPAQNPREADELMLEYRTFLFDRLRVEPRNIIYAAESNPFEVYRQIVRSIRGYKLALAPLGGCKGVVSAMSSKLSSLGALLAAYELQHSAGDDHVDVGVAHVETHGYCIVPGGASAPATLYNLWLAGECYDDRVT
jgi:hypothetical protein